MKDLFKNKDGSLTLYAFACGYIQICPKTGVSLAKDGCWHIKYYENGERYWECEDTLTEAGKHFKRKVKEVKGLKTNKVIDFLNDNHA